jgi:hypothetical protein
MEITLKDMKELFGATAVELPFEVGQTMAHSDGDFCCDRSK